tara:strand:+ start:27 stop:467 length:441 start_codon:yes stop_codon:yes gene_type:complete
MASIKNMSKFAGQLYTFGYTSWGPKDKKRRANIDKQPLLLLAVKNGQKSWRAKNKGSYVYGFNLNYLESNRRLEVIKQLVIIFAEHEGELLGYDAIKGALDLPTAKENSIFRKYDARGSKLRRLAQVDLNTYAVYLEDALSTDDDD